MITSVCWCFVPNRHSHVGYAFVSVEKALECQWTQEVGMGVGWGRGGEILCTLGWLVLLQGF